MPSKFLLSKYICNRAIVGQTNKGVSSLIALRMQAKSAVEGDVVGVRYHGTLDDGSVFDENRGRDNPEGPLLEFELGSGRVIKGFERAVRGLGIGESREVKCCPDEAYGDYNEDNVATIPRKDMPDPPDGIVLEAGMMVRLGNGQVVVVKEVSTEEVVLDANHPLAGKTLNFKVTVHEIKDAEVVAVQRRDKMRQLLESPLIRAIAPEITKDPAYVDKTLALLAGPGFDKHILSQVERSAEWEAISTALMNNPQLQELLEHPERVEQAGLDMKPLDGGAVDQGSKAVEADFLEDA